MMRSLYSAVSGLKTHQTRMDVIGNNISNVNTEAFKASTVTFTEVMYQTTSSASAGNGATGVGGINAKQIGLGVSTGATTINITGAGAAQTTGNPFDLKLTDSQTTNFFIVSDGTKNLFTRAGSFYVDGNGYLCMSSTGYTLMGWQVDPETGLVVKDTVSPLQVMSAQNQTSSPEATEKGYVSGVLDKNDSDVKGDNGYTMNLGFFDDLGYSYTAKFAVRPTDAEKGEYDIRLSDIIDMNSKSIFQDGLEVPGENEGETVIQEGRYYINAEKKATNIRDIFGGTKKREYTSEPLKKVAHVNNLTDAEQGEVDKLAEGTIVVGPEGEYYAVTQNANNVKSYVLATVEEVDKHGGGYFSYKDGRGADKTVSLGKVFGYRPSDDIDLTLNGNNSISGATVTYTETTTAYSFNFNTADGTFASVVTDGQSTANLQLSILGTNFKDIEMDFSKTLNYNNGGTSTLKMTRGDATGNDAGKKLGALIGVSVDTDGSIYGSYNNGNTVLLGQIAVAQFANASGLEKVGSNCYQTTLNSGEFDGIGLEVKADGSSISTGELEMSNVDLSGQFTDMIVTQRGFQANSRVITTSDTLLEELINLKR